MALALSVCQTVALPCFSDSHYAMPQMLAVSYTSSSQCAGVQLLLDIRCYEAADSLSFSVATYAKLCGRNSALCRSIVPKTLFARSPISSFCIATVPASAAMYMDFEQLRMRFLYYW